MNQYVGFRVKDEEYMVPILKVREIISLPHLTRLPDLPEFIRGVTEIRGSVIPVVDMENLLYQHNNGSGKNVIIIVEGKASFGIIVDEITGIIRLDEKSIETPEKIGSNNLERIIGVAKLPDRLIMLLNTKKILPLEDTNLFNDNIIDIKAVEGTDNVEVTREIDTIGGKITIKELKDAKEFMGQRFESSDPRQKILDKMISFMDALAVHDYSKVEAITEELMAEANDSLFKEIGRITRKLHNSLEEFKRAVDQGIQKIKNNKVPDAVDSLQFVISQTEAAADKTMTIVERYFEESEDLMKNINSIKGNKNIVNYLKQFKEGLDNDMTEILTAQQFQDITGQTIKKVIDLIHNIESELVELIRNFGIPIDDSKTDSNMNKEDYSAEKVSQSDIESLLKEYGF